MKGRKNVPGDPEWLEIKAENPGRKGHRPSQRVCLVTRGDGSHGKRLELGSDTIRPAFCKEQPLPAMWGHCWKRAEGLNEP